MMIRRWLWTAAVLMTWAMPALGETVHLTSGESIKGRIISIEEDIIAIESERGFGVIEIQRSDIRLIENDEAVRNPDRTMGLGYFHRVNPATAGGGAVDYGLDAFSIKYWISPDSSIDFLVGFFSSETAGSKDFEVFSFDFRYAQVFKREAFMDLYYGAGAGFISVTDRTGTADLDDNGQTLRVFLGAEMFFVTMPNLGLSAEVAFGTQSVGDRKITNLSTTTFPAFSLRYYF